MRTDQLPHDLADGVRIATAQGLDGYEDNTGTFVDPRPVQLGAIREGFRAASKIDDFDVFTVVSPSRVRADEPLVRNFNRVFRQWSQQTDRVAHEVAAQLREMGHEIDGY